jgi:hypothetical protein
MGQLVFASIINNKVEEEGSQHGEIAKHPNHITRKKP